MYCREHHTIHKDLRKPDSLGKDFSSSRVPAWCVSTTWRCGRVRRRVRHVGRVVASSPPVHSPGLSVITRQCSRVGDTRGRRLRKAARRVQHRTRRAKLDGAVLSCSGAAFAFSPRRLRGSGAALLKELRVPAA